MSTWKEDIKPNTIYYTTNIETLNEVVKKIDKKNSHLSKNEFAKKLATYITNKMGMVLVSFNEKKELNGCVVLSHHIDRKGEYLWYDFHWTDPNRESLMDKFYNEIIGVCKSLGIKRMQGRAGRCFRVVKKYYGAYEIGRIFEVNMERVSIKDGNKKYNN